MNSTQNLIQMNTDESNWILPSATKTLMNYTQNLNQMNTDESKLDITKRNKNSHELYSKFDPDEH